MLKELNAQPGYPLLVSNNHKNNKQLKTTNNLKSKRHEKSQTSLSQRCPVSVVNRSRLSETVSAVPRVWQTTNESKTP